MVVLFLFLLLPMIPLSKSLDINLSSIRIVPDLYRFCWKQYTAEIYGDIRITRMSMDAEQMLRIFKDPQSEGNVYCVEKKDKISGYYLKLPIWGLREEKSIQFRVNFSVPLRPVLPLVRKKIVSNGVHFQLSRDFRGIFNISIESCINIVIYGPNKKESKLFFMNMQNSKHQISLKPGTEFDFYYICNDMWTSTGTTTDHGTVFWEEKTQPLQPFLQFPFTRFLIGQWKNRPNLTDIYQIEIFEINPSNIPNCLKIFRLYSSSKPVNSSNVYPEICGKGINTEDLGTVDLGVDGNIYVVLDMGVPLKKDVRYKMSIWWQKDWNQWEDNYIYFEPLPNENSGNIHSDIYNYEPTEISDRGNIESERFNIQSQNYQEVRNKISDMRQNVITQYTTDVSSAMFLKLSKFDEMMILPTVSSSPFKRLTSPKTISYDELNEKCKEIPSCSNTLHPLFYVMLTNKSQTDNFVELLPIPLKESVYIDNVKSSSNSENGTIIISFELPRNKTYTPSLFAIRLRWENNTCFELDVLLCRTCNKEHKEVSERNFNESFSSWKRDCQRYERFDNYYGAMDSVITFKIKERIPEWIPIANVHSINLYDMDSFNNIDGKNNESFWSKYGTIVISLLCTVFGLSLIIPIALWLKSCVKKNRNHSERNVRDYDYDDDVL